MGFVELALTFPNGEVIRTVRLECENFGMAYAVRRSVDVRGAPGAEVSVLLGQIPPGEGYRCGMTAVSESGMTLCSGWSTSFEVRGAFTTQVSIRVQCSSLIFCGDGVLDAGEECDDGARNGAASDCTALVDARGGCRVKRCADGVRDSATPTRRAEECDDGNQLNDDGCSQACLVERCGDGVPQSSYCLGSAGMGRDGGPLPCRTDQDCAALSGSLCGEECDFASDPLTREVCTADADPRGGCRYRRCGDGVVDPAVRSIAAEECDDGNRIDGDGCDRDCRQR